MGQDQRLHQIPELELKVQQLENDKLELTESLQVCQKQMLGFDGRSASFVPLSLTPFSRLPHTCIMSFHKGSQVQISFWAFFARKFVAETEQKSMNRVLLSNSLREKELEKELWLLEAQLIGRSWRVYHLLPYICCLHRIKQWLAAQWIAQGQEICCVLLSYLYLLVQFHALFWHVEWPGDEDKLRGAAENAAARAWAAAKGKGCNH